MLVLKISKFSRHVFYLIQIMIIIFLNQGATYKAVGSVGREMLKIFYHGGEKLNALVSKNLSKKFSIRPISMIKIYLKAHHLGFLTHFESYVLDSFWIFHCTLKFSLCYLYDIYASFLSLTILSMTLLFGNFVILPF